MGEYQKQYYERNLSHIAEPASPKERDEANSQTIEEYEGLWLAQQLREYAAYGDVDDEEASIARGYAQYIDRVVREQTVRNVTLYAHTEKAAATLYHAIEYVVPPHEQRRDYPMSIHRSIEEASAVLQSEFLDEVEE